jgi:hypothetical protein
MEQIINKSIKKVGERSKDRAKRKTGGYYNRWGKLKDQKIRELKHQIKLLNRNLKDSKKIYDDRLKLFAEEYFSGAYENINPTVKEFLSLWKDFMTDEEIDELEDRLDDEMFKELEAIYEEKNKTQTQIKSIN